MTREEALKIVNDIFIDILDNEDIKLELSSNSEDIEEWDSLNHIQLVVAVEKKFKQKFTASEIRNWTNVGDMIDMILSRMG